MSSFQFHTTVDIPKMKWETGYSKTNLFIGSCFTESIGNKMAALKYKVDVNPFGILYNPVSVANGLRILLQNKYFENNDLLHHDGLFYSFSHHGRFSFPTQTETLDAINSRIKSSSELLKKADFLFITFGTAWIYKWKETGQPVSNCHKIPDNEFQRLRLSVTEIVNDYLLLLDEIKKGNPTLKVIFTVSPVRHWKDGAIENQRSKATLLLAIDEIIKKVGNDSCAYFPSYEIMMDELRDYRFYADDMLHISDLAVNYIWDKFVATFIDEESRIAAKEVGKIVKAKNHRQSGKNILAYQNFLKMTLEKIKTMEKKFKGLDMREEKLYFLEKLQP